MRVEGRCHSGQISYKAIIDPEKLRLDVDFRCSARPGNRYGAALPSIGLRI